MVNLSFFLPTLARLGFNSVKQVASYRLACRTGLYRHLMPVQAWKESGEFFSPSPVAPPDVAHASREALRVRAERLLAGELDYFSVFSQTIGSPPDWFFDPLNKVRIASDGHWSMVDEFSGGDIKNVWEASRFEWVPLLARAWCLAGDGEYIETLNNWLHDWALRNPTNSGPNWKCSQEASIRTINLLLGARLLGAHKRPSPALVELVVRHCARILPTIRYAVAQNNNHGTSEAAALFIGGSWLTAVAGSAPLRNRARKWREAGRRWLEERVAKLVERDGSFSQYSVNYHRVLVDTLSQVELWRRELEEQLFSLQLYERCRAAVEWLAALTDVATGNAPNLGANDGARLYDLSVAPYRDFRPSVQLASVLFRGVRTYGPGVWDEPLSWLELEASADIVPAPTGSVIHEEGGYLLLKGNNSSGLIRFTRFRFRPSHADCLHLDLWHRGENILRDGGTYSYNTEARWLDYFSGTESHNTVQFDGRNQMPRIGRFLFGNWIKMDECSGIQNESGCLSWTGSYSDWQRAWHRRSVSVCGNTWKVTDEVGGFRDKAVLRWRLIPGNWTLAGTICDSRHATLCVSSKRRPRRIELTTGWESLCYQQKTELPVLEVEFGPGEWTIETEITLKD